MTPMSKFFTACVCVMSLTIGSELAAHAATSPQVTLPQLPRAQVDVTMPTVTGSTLNATCATLQAQLNAAAALNVNLTHEVMLATGTTCTGPYKLPAHSGGTGWILIKGPNFASLPPSGTRVSPSDAALMPSVKYGESGNYTGAFAAQTDAQRYRIIGINIVQNDTVGCCPSFSSGFEVNWALVVLGHNNQSATNTGYFILDRVLMRDTNATHSTYHAVYGEADEIGRAHV